MSDIKQSAQGLQRHLDATYQKLLPLLSDPGRRDAGAITNFVTYSQRLKDKLINYSKVKSEAPV